MYLQRFFCTWDKSQTTHHHRVLLRLTKVNSLFAARFIFLGVSLIFVDIPSGSRQASGLLRMYCTTVCTTQYTLLNLYFLEELTPALCGTTSIDTHKALMD